MWSKYASGLLQSWSKTLREKLQLPRRQPPRITSPSEASKASPSSTGSADASYQQQAKGSWKDTVTSSPSYISAKEYSSKLKESAKEKYIKRVPTDWNSAKTSLNEWTQPAQQKLKESATRASSQVKSEANRIVTEQYSKSKPIFQKAYQSSSDHFSKSMTHAASAASTTASQVAQSTKDTLVTELQNTRKQAFRWLWWWSLAAIAVYGIATTLPGTLLREYYRRQKEEEKNPKAIQAGKKQIEKDTSAIEGDKSTIKEWIPSGWFPSSRRSSNDNEAKKQQDSWYNLPGWPLGKQPQEEKRQESWIPQLGWPTLSSGKQEKQESSKESWINQIGWPNFNRKEPRETDNRKSSWWGWTKGNNDKDQR